MNVPLALWPPTSVATTAVPEVELGTLNVQLNAPELPVVNDPGLQLEIVTVSSTSDVSVDETEKPVPDTVTDVPSGPTSGETTMLSDVTKNDCAEVSDLVVSSSATMS